MLYSEFVKEHMMKLKGSDMSAPQKMKYIAEQWKKSKDSNKSQSKPKMESKSKKDMQHSNEILNMLGIDMKKTKSKPKSERAVKKVVKAMEKMTIPIEEKMTEMPKHPVHLLEKEEIKHKKMFDDEDDIGF
jgi:hypothetical protein